MGASTIHKTILDTLSESIYFRDLDKNILYMNPASETLTGWTFEQAHGKKCYEVFGDSEQACFNCCPAEKAIANQCQVLDHEQLLKTRDGSLKHVKLTITPVHDGENEKGAIIIINDYSAIVSMKEKHIDAQLMRSERLESIGTLAAGIAHDFNNILSSIIGYTELAMDDSSPESLLYSNLQEVLLAGNRATELVKQILTFSNQTENNPVPVQMQLLIRDALKLVRASLPSSIQIIQELRSQARVMAEPAQIQQVVLNLAANAAHSMENTGGTLSIELTDEVFSKETISIKSDIAPGYYVKLSIGDTGHGMTASVLSRAFNPFFTTKQQGEGSGMGLSVVHGIVTSLGGFISPYSEHGKGSTFNIYLPAMEHGEHSPHTSDKTMPNGTETILLIDDEVPIIKMGKQLLERLGYTVEVRTSSIEALELFKVKPDRFDLVITDLTMPNMSGLDLAREIGIIRRDIPVILCTGLSKIIIEKKAETSGIRAVISKPILTGEIATTIRHILDTL